MSLRALRTTFSLSAADPFKGVRLYGDQEAPVFATPTGTPVRSLKPLLRDTGGREVGAA